MKNKIITNIYNQPKWYWFLPFIGFFTYMKFIMTKKHEFENDKEFTKLKQLEKKLFIFLNIFSIFLFIINIFVFNIGFFIWKKLVKKAGYIL